MEIPGNLLKAITCDAGGNICVVHLGVHSQVISDLGKAGYSHDDHKTQVCLDLCCTGRSHCTCRTKYLCCKAVGLPHDQRYDVVVKKVRKHL